RVARSMSGPKRVAHYRFGTGVVNGPGLPGAVPAGRAATRARRWILDTVNDPVDIIEHGAVFPSRDRRGPAVQSLLHTADRAAPRRALGHRLPARRGARALRARAPRQPHGYRARARPRPRPRLPEPDPPRLRAAQAPAAHALGVGRPPESPD